MPKTMYLLGMIMQFLSSSKEDGYFLCDSFVAPGTGAPPNRHPDESESFFVREGSITFTVEGVETRAGPGDYVKVPRGGVHSFHNATDRPARMLILNVPGFIHENVFNECGTELEPGTTEFPADPPEVDMDRVISICAKHGLELGVGG